LKIVDVKVMGLTYPLKEPFYSAVRKTVARSCVLLEVHTDAGIVGLGEADYAGGPPASTIQVLREEIIPLILGKDPFEVEGIGKTIYDARMQHGRRGILMHALSGVDIALWDIIGKAAKLPLYQLLGSNTDRVRVYASGGLYRDEFDPTGMKGLLEEVQAALERGFQAYKMKIGRLSFAADLKRVQEVRKLLGPDRELMVDCNNNWDLPTALKWLPYLEELDVKFIEEPFPVDNLEDSARLAEKTRIPLAGFENETNLWGFRDIITKNAAYFIQPNAARVGGITAMRKIAALAQAFNRSVCPHAFSSMVCIMANMHLLATLPNGVFLEYDVNENALREELNLHPLVIDNGWVQLPQRPGLGVELNRDTVGKYLLK